MESPTPDSGRAQDHQKATMQHTIPSRPQQNTTTHHELCTKFYEDTCKCSKADGKPSALDHFEDMCALANIMSKDELDFVLIGIINDNTAHSREHRDL